MIKFIRITAISILLLLPGLAPAQGYSLVFSQVHTFAQNNVTACPHTIGTVPAGKVWKIEHMSGTRNGYMPNFVFFVNGVESYDMYSTSMQSYFYPNQYPKGAIWLKAGDAIRFQNCSSSYPAYYFISVIEFNLVSIP